MSQGPHPPRAFVTEKQIFKFYAQRLNLIASQNFQGNQEFKTFLRQPVPSIAQTWDEKRTPRQARVYSPTHSFCVVDFNNCIRLNLFNLTTQSSMR